MPAVHRIPRQTATLVAVSLATFMTYLDNNIVNVAMPAIQRDLHLSTAGLEWVVSGYILAFASLLLAGGRLGDIFGRRRLFLLGLGVFTLASLVAGFASGDVVLITSRVVQGVGAALVTPTTLALITSTFPDIKARTAAIGVWSAVGALALAVGPLLGGLLSQHVSWGWIFFINVPVGLATMVLAASVIAPDAPRVPQTRVDVPGLLTSVVALFALTYALIEGHDEGWTSPLIVGSFGLSGLALLAFVVIERRADDPMVDVALFANRAFTGGITAVLMWGFGIFGIYFFTSLYLQNVLGFSATKAGAAFVPMAILMAVGAIMSERVAAALGSHRSVALAMALMAIGIASVSLLGKDASFLALMPSFALIGIGGGLSVPLTAMVVNAMPPAHAGVASGIFNGAREVAGLLGITVIGAILAARQSASLHAGHAPVDAFLSGYRTGLLVAGALVAAGGVAAYLALRQTPQPDADVATELVLVG